MGEAESSEAKNFLSEQIRAVLELVETDSSLAHLIPILAAAREASSKGMAFSEEDVIRVADFMMKLPGVSSIDEAIARARVCNDGTGPNMFARALIRELQRRKAAAL